MNFYSICLRPFSAAGMTAAWKGADWICSIKGLADLMEWRNPGQGAGKTRKGRWIWNLNRSGMKDRKERRRTGVFWDLEICRPLVPIAEDNAINAVIL